MHTPEGSLWSVWIVVFNEPRQTRPSPVTKYANIARLNRFYQFFALFISISLCRKRSSALSVRQTSSPYPPARYLKTLYTDNLCYLMMHIQDGRLVIVGAQRVQVRSSRSRVRITLQELFLIWLGGRITSPRVWFGAGEQGVTLKLAWGPSISSPWNLRFVFVVFFIFPSLSSLYVLFYFIFPTIAEHLSFWATVISIGHGFGTSQLLFFFVLFEIGCNIFISVYVIIIIIVITR